MTVCQSRGLIALLFGAIFVVSIMSVLAEITTNDNSTDILNSSFTDANIKDNKLYNLVEGYWMYSRKIDIQERSGNTLTNYQVIINLNSANFNFSHAKLDGSDIRFISDNAELPYWIETWNAAGKQGKLWVKIPIINANALKNIEMYYGNPNANAVSNGLSTFEFFDDFAKSTLDPKWTKVSGDWHVGNGVLTHIGTGLVNVPTPDVLVSNYATNMGGYAIHANIKWIKNGYFEDGIVWNYRPSNASYYLALLSTWTPSTNGARMYRLANGDDVIEEKDVPYSGITKNRWYKFAVTCIKEYPLNEFSFYVDGTKTISSWIPITQLVPNFIGLGGWKGQYFQEVQYDDFFIRKYTSLEPTVTISNINNPPNTPSTPSGRKIGYTGNSYDFSTYASDPDGSKVKYTFDWGDGTTSETEFLPSGSPSSLSHIWTIEGTYEIKAMATDIHGLKSKWSKAKLLGVKSDAPEILDIEIIPWDIETVPPLTNKDVTFKAIVRVPEGHEVISYDWLIRDLMDPTKNKIIHSSTNTCKYKFGNGEYGKKEIRCTVKSKKTGEIEIIQTIGYNESKVFFPKDPNLKNSDDDKDGIPNWFEYWKKDGAVPGMEDVEYDGRSEGYGYENWLGQVYICKEASEVHYPGGIPVKKDNGFETFGGNNVKGIDCAAEVVAHENYHKIVDSFTGTDSDKWQGDTSIICLKEWNISGWKICLPMLYIKGGPCPDGLPDSYENTISGTNASIPDTWNVEEAKGYHPQYKMEYATYGDQEYMAMRTANGVRGNPDNDWGYPGKQTKGLLFYPNYEMNINWNSSETVLETEITGNYSDKGEDLNNNSLFDYLKISTDLNISKGGTYSIIAWLNDSSNEEVAFVNDIYSFSNGIVSVNINFDGLTIYRHQTSGPYMLTLKLYDDEGFELDSEVDVYQTAAYSYTDFEGQQGELTGSFSDSGVDSNGDSVFESLKINVGVAANSEGNFTVEGFLYDQDNNSIASASAVAHILTGNSTIALLFNGTDIANSKRTGPYLLRYLKLIAGNDSEIDFKLDAYSTDYYETSDFLMQDARLKRVYTDLGADEDGDGLFEYLQIDADANITEEGDFILGGTLYNSSDGFIDLATSQVHLDPGQHKVPLKFDGSAIFRNGANETFSLQDVILYRKSDMTIRDSDMIPYITANYSFMLFKSGINKAPNTPTMPIGQASGVAGTSYTYSTSATDPDGDQIVYTFDWGDGTNSETISFNSSINASAAHIWNNAGIYEVKAKATDSKGLVSEWSNAINVSIADWPYISGTKFNDTNSNATCDAGEAGLSGWTIRLTRPDGTTINATTDANGAYKFENLTSGTYRVSEVRQSNWTQTYPAWLGDHIINVTDGNVTGVDFGNNYLPVPEIPFPPAGPASGIPGVEYSYTTSSTDPSGYQIAYTFDWGDGSNSTTGLFDSGAVASAAHIWNSSGIYQVRAMATNSKGASSGWSDPLNVTINAPPSTPAVPVGPTSGIPGAEYSYTTSATDPDGDQISYTFDWGDGTNSTSPLFDSGAIANATHTWNNAGIYGVKTKATDSNGLDSEWSNEINVSIANNSCISGTKFNDTNSNATRDPGEAGLSGWTIRLTRPDGTTINATTDANGAYKFENLTRGTYRVSEIRQSNWTQTYPAWLGDHIINVTDGNITGVDFGNNFLPVPDIPFPPAGPASGIPGAEYSYSTSSTDPSGYQIAYTFDWGDGSNSTTGLFDSGALASAAHIWNSSGVYHVRAMATDSKGASSDWSDPLVVSITNPVFGWSALGGYITSSPSAIMDNQDQTEVWVKGGDNALWLNIDGSWQGKGGYLTSDPFAAEDYNGRIHVLARGGDNGAWDFIYDPVTQSGEWIGLGGYITEGLTAAKDPANHNLMRVAARGGDEALWTCDLDINSRSSSWNFQGGVLTSRPYILFDPSGREHILLRGGDNALWDRNGEWTGSSYSRTWSLLGGILANSPIATIEPGADSHIAIFAKGGHDAIWMCDVDSSSETETGSWHRLGGVISSDIFAVADSSGSKIHTFARGSDMALWENAFTTSPWNPEGGQWQYLGGLILDYRPGATLTDITQAFVIGADNGLWQNTQATASAKAGDARSCKSEAEKEIQSSITDQDLREMSKNKQKDAKTKLELMKSSIADRMAKAKQI